MCKNNEIVATLPEGATPDERRAAFFEAAYSLNVNEKVEKRENLSYLSWANAVAEFLKIYPSATYRIIKNPATNLPYFEDANTGLIVYTEVTVDGITREMWLPVMNSANKAMKLTPYTYTKWDKVNRKNIELTVEAATMFDVNKTIMRCLVKNFAMFGLGLYIYAGEDLPEAENNGNSEESTTTVKMVEPKKTTTRKAKTVAAPQQPKQNDRFAAIKTAINSMQDIDSLLALYNEHKQEIEGGSPEIKAMFTLRKYELQQAA